MLSALVIVGTVQQRYIDYLNYTALHYITNPCMGASRQSSTHRRRVLSSSLVCATLRPSSFSTIDR